MGYRISFCSTDLFIPFDANVPIVSVKRHTAKMQLRLSKVSSSYKTLQARWLQHWKGALKKIAVETTLGLCPLDSRPDHKSRPLIQLLSIRHPVVKTQADTRQEMQLRIALADQKQRSLQHSPSYDLNWVLSLLELGSEKRKSRQEKAAVSKK